MAENITKLKSFKVTAQGFDIKTTLPTLSEIVDIEYSQLQCTWDTIYRIKSFNDFLKQPLKLNMFIPCKDGVPLEVPTGLKFIIEADNEKQANELVGYALEYQQALDRVIFKDCHLLNNIIYIKEYGYFHIKNKSISDLCNKVDLVDKEYERLNL